MTNRTQESYHHLFTKLKFLKPTISPKSMMTAIEFTAIKGFHQVFPDVAQRGCYFHHKQCMFRKLQTLGSVFIRYNLNLEFQLNVKMLPALAFIPVNKVVFAFLKLIDSPRWDDDDLFKITTYYSDIWIRGAGIRNRRKPVIFEPKFWNVFDAVKQDIPKTNNDVTDWHNRLRSYIPANHPSIWNFIYAIKKDVQLTFVDDDDVQSSVGSNSKKNRTHYKDYMRKLHDLLIKYEIDSLNTSFNILNYLVNIAHNI
jgi:hypothetical protein